MTNERAIELLHRISDSQFDGIHGDERREALEMAVRALFSQQIVNDSQGLVNDCISRQAAIDLLKKWSDGYSYIEVETNSAIKAFEEMPHAQPEVAKDTNVPNNDCISRQAAIVAVKDALLAWSSMPEWRDDKITEALVELPSAQQQRKRGKWIILPPIFEEICQCSNCKMKFKDALQWTNDCPNCGADMRGER